MPRIGLGDQQPGRVAARVALDLAARRVRRVLRVADGAQGGAVEQRAVVEVQDEDRRIRRDRVDLLQRRQALLGELMLGQAADDAHPLRRRRDRHLRLQHGHRIGQRRHAVPAQLHVEVEPAADDVQVVVDEAGNDASAAQIQHACVPGPASASIIAAVSRPPRSGHREWRWLTCGISGSSVVILAIEEDDVGASVIDVTPLPNGAKAAAAATPKP